MPPRQRSARAIQADYRRQEIRDIVGRIRTRRIDLEQEKDLASRHRKVWEFIGAVSYLEEVVITQLDGLDKLAK